MTEEQVKQVHKVLPSGEGKPDVQVMPGGVMLRYPSAAAYRARTSKDMEALGSLKTAMVESSCIEVDDPLCVRVRLIGA